MTNTNNEKIQIIYGDCTLGLKVKNCHYIFSYTKGGLESLKKDGKEWLYREITPIFWRATTDNDRGSCFHFKSCMWLGATLKQTVENIQVKVNHQPIDLPIAPNNNQYTQEEFADNVEICFTLLVNSTPQTKVTMTYLVNQAAEMKVTLHYFGKVGLPELPALGVRFIMPTPAISYEYEGLSGETYPDRMNGAQEGVYTITGLPITPYLVPQDCMMHMQTKWLTITRNQTLNNVNQKPGNFSLSIQKASHDFAFTALPFKAEELEQATHWEELPPKRRTVLTIYHKVRGVGGINSWGEDVTKPYHLSAQEDHEICFIVK
ncbi:MAG TPA: beta-galactosidase small subunit [Enterococcus columbae]|nr:beta-galactosidase small subunit [Enterococcus columbae]